MATDKVRAGRLATTGLVLVAGFADAYGYLGWRVFGANMTGNTIIFAISLYENAERAYLPLGNRRRSTAPRDRSRPEDDRKLLNPS